MDALGSMASGATYAAMGLSSANCAVTGARAGVAAAAHARAEASLEPEPEAVAQIEARLLVEAESADHRDLPAAGAGLLQAKPQLVGGRSRAGGKEGGGEGGEQ